jgi:hypothetical protein
MAMVARSLVIGVFAVCGTGHGITGKHNTVSPVHPAFPGKPYGFNFIR